MSIYYMSNCNQYFLYNTAMLNYYIIKASWKALLYYLIYSVWEHVCIACVVGSLLDWKQQEGTEQLSQIPSHPRTSSDNYVNAFLRIFVGYKRLEVHYNIYSVWELVCIARRSGVYQTESNRKEQSSSPKYHPNPGPRLIMMQLMRSLRFLWCAGNCHQFYQNKRSAFELKQATLFNRVIYYAAWFEWNN